MDYKERILARIESVKKEIEEAKERHENAHLNFSGKDLRHEWIFVGAIIEQNQYLLEQLELMIENGDEDQEEG